MPLDDTALIALWMSLQGGGALSDYAIIQARPYRDLVITSVWISTVRESCS